MSTALAERDELEQAIRSLPDLSLLMYFSPCFIL